ncbi:MAG: 30S ribosomal protein S1 [Deltaproteobacteria bacterium]|nr:30S ribosomal protein S1 [Deltaproteobacteria bacterium]
MENKSNRPDRSVGADEGGQAGPIATGRNEDDFAKLYEESIEVPEEGQIIHGVVIKVLKEYVAVDINRKSEGMLPLEELPPEEAAALVPGKRIDIMVERYDSEQGFVLLSRSKVLKIRVWDDLQKAFDEGTAVPGSIVAKVKGGFTVEIGVKAFLPGSQVDIRPVRDNDSVVGLAGKFKILKFSRKKANVVVSRRAALEEERESQKKGILEKIQEGDTVEARVKNITDYGVFMDLGGLDGLMHITDMSYGKVTHPSDICKVGEPLKVKVIRFDREKGRISLGLKQMKSDPWLDIETRYAAGGRARGRVTNITKYGAFIELEEGVEGLLHVSEMSWSKKLRDPSEILKAGDTVDVVILRVEKEHKKISLGLKQLLVNPWDELRAKHPEGSTVEGVVKNITDFGVFVDVGSEIDGLVHVSDISWNQRVKHPSEMFKKGDRVQARVLKIDPESQKFSLSIKHLTLDPWTGIEARFRKGDVVNGKATRVADFGVFVELADGVEGLVHISELSREKVESPGSLFKPGDEIGAVVLSVDRANKKISLSIRSYHDDLDRKNMESYMSRSSEPSDNLTVLGEALRAKLKINSE